MTLTWTLNMSGACTPERTRSLSASDLGPRVNILQRNGISVNVKIGVVQVMKGKNEFKTRLK